MRRATMVLLLGVLLSLPAWGCTGVAREGGGSGSGEITQADIEASPARDGYQLVERLRPQWLRGRGSASLRDALPSVPVVYVEGIREGGPETLRRVDAAGILRIEYLGAPDATTRFGTGHTGGAILVTLRR